MNHFLKPVVGLFGLAWFAFAGLISCADEQDKEKPVSPSKKPVIVPLDLSDWQASVSVVPQNGPHQKYSRPRVEVRNTGAVVIKKGYGTDVNEHMEEDVAKSLFAGLAATINGFYLTKSEGPKYGPSEMHDANTSKYYRVRFANGSRAVQLTLEQAQPSRMGLEPQFYTVIAAVNRQLRRESANDRLPEPFRLDGSYRDPSIDEVRQVVPEDLVG